jgi:YkoY family integral membrane protein
MFGQTFEAHDLAVVALLVVLEGVLSIDNALVLGLLAKRLPKHQQKRALTYGLVGAFVFRLIAVGTAVFLMRWWWVKLLGGGYLIYIAVKHLFFESKEDEPEHLAADATGEVVLVDAAGHEVSTERSETAIRERIPVPMPAASRDESVADPLKAVEKVPDCDPRATGGKRKCAAFWPTVVVIELTDIAFAIDSILAAIALAPRQEKLWVVMTGGMSGVILMRVAAVFFIRLLNRFPRMELAAYLLVIVIGLKLLLDWWFNKPPEGWPVGATFHGPLDFHSPSAVAFWGFWVAMAGAFAVGFIPRKQRAAGKPA